MTKIEQYLLDGIPRLEDIQEAISIAKEKHCIVEIVWHMEWSGWYKRYIRETDEAEEYFDKNIPKIYGV